MKKQQRLQQKIETLNQQWDTLNKKLSRLEQARILETDEAEKIKLEAGIAETKQQWDDIEQQIETLESQLADSPAGHINKLLFINAAAQDALLCERICRLLKEEDLAEYVELKVEQHKPSEIREAFETWILDCDALVVMYGRVNLGWLNQIVRDVRKVVWQRAEQPLPAYIVCDPKPEQKQLVQFRFRGISAVHYASCNDEHRFREFVNSL